MEDWWLCDDDFDLCAPGRSPDEIFGSLLDCDHVTSVPELTIEDYEDLDKLLYECSPLSISGSSVDESVNSPPCSEVSDDSVCKLVPRVSKEDSCRRKIRSATATVNSENSRMIVPALCPQVSSESVELIQTDEKSQMEPTNDTLSSLLAELTADSANGDCTVEDLLDLADFADGTFIPSPEAGCVTSPWSPGTDVAQPGLTKPTESDQVAKTRSRSEGGTNMYFCQFCGREFKHKIGLKNHERSHVRGETHMCGYCGKKFRYKNKLRRHVNVHARQLRICRFCGQVQSSDYELVQHEKKHKKDGKKTCGLKSLPGNGYDHFTRSVLTTDTVNSANIPPCTNQPWSSLCMAFSRTQQYPKHNIRLHSV